MGSVILDDRTGRIEVTCFSEVYEQVRDLLAADRILVISGSMSFDDYRDSWSLRADQVRTLEQAREALADHLCLALDRGEMAEQTRGRALVAELRGILAAFSGRGLRVRIDYRRPGARGQLVLGGAWRVQPTDELLKRLRYLLGAEAVEVSYERLPAPIPVPAEQARRPKLAVVK
jgi:DNA polymerase-3 subunit alpha